MQPRLAGARRGRQSDVRSRSEQPSIQQIAMPTELTRGRHRVAAGMALEEQGGRQALWLELRLELHALQLRRRHHGLMGVMYEQTMLLFFERLFRFLDLGVSGVAIQHACCHRTWTSELASNDLHGSSCLMFDATYFRAHSCRDCVYVCEVFNLFAMLFANDSILGFVVECVLLI